MFSALTTIWINRNLVWRLAKRELEAQFRGSLLGLAWTVLSPLAMLAVYSLVFGGIFTSRWPRSSFATTNHDFAFPMLLFLGLTVFTIFSDPLNRAPTLILQNATYVKKVVFPIEVLPVTVVVNALVTSGITLFAFLIVYFLMYGSPPLTIFSLPIVLAPTILFSVGFTFLLSSFGVFFRDLRQIIPPFTTALLFLSTTFFAAENVPDQFRWVLYFNPVTYAVNFARDVVFWGHLPDPLQWTAFLLASLVFLSLSMAFFVRTKKAFADVL
jgi:lipopolysaccharide transport system permease protein